MVGTKNLNPECGPIDAARYIRDVRVTTISPGTVTGHASAGGFSPPMLIYSTEKFRCF